MPGRASNWSLVAELRSSRSALAGAAVAAVSGGVAACAAAIPLDRQSAKNAIRSLLTNFLVIVISRLRKSLLERFIISSRLGIDPALADCVSHAVDRQHISGDAVIHSMSFGVADNIIECRHHDLA